MLLYCIRMAVAPTHCLLIREGIFPVARYPAHGITEQRHPYSLLANHTPEASIRP